MSECNNCGGSGVIYDRTVDEGGALISILCGVCSETPAPSPKCPNPECENGFVPDMTHGSEGFKNCPDPIHRPSPKCPNPECKNGFLPSEFSPEWNGLLTRLCPDPIHRKGDASKSVSTAQTVVISNEDPDIDPISQYEKGYSAGLAASQAKAERLVRALKSAADIIAIMETKYIEATPGLGLKRVPMCVEELGAIDAALESEGE